MFDWLKSFSKTPPSEDVRGKRIVAVIECILNQNARDCGAACLAAMNFELVRLCHEADVGIVQMPCPEIELLGLKRQRSPGQSIRDALATEAGQAGCATLAVSIADRLTAYLDDGYELVAILGGNPRSPGCAVLQENSGLRDDSGIFMKQLHSEMCSRKHDVVFGALRDHDPELLRQDLRWFAELVQRTATTGERPGS